MADVAATVWADGHLPMVGRDEELERLLAAARAAAAGTPQAVIVAGDAGVGKTRLLRSFRAGLPGDVRVVEGHCIDLGDVGLPYLPFTEALSQLPASAVEGRALGPLLPGAPEAAAGDVGRLQLYDAVAGALQAAGPAVLLVEDLHWADASSRDLLRFLLARVRDERLLVVATYRADDLHRRHPLRPLLAELGRLGSVSHIDLSPLPPDLLREHLASVGPLPESLLGPVVERSEGNPYFAEELLTAALEAGYVDGRVLPARLADVVLARLERLSAVALAVIRVAAVAGRRVDADLLAAACFLAGVPADAGLREAVEAQVLVTSADRVSFRHALLQETVYDDLLPGERVRLHAVFAEVLADRPSAAAERAHHAEQSGDQEGAYAQWVRAGEDASAAHAPREALTSYDRALRLTALLSRTASGVSPSDTALLLLRSGAAAAEAGELLRAVEHTGEAVRVALEAGLTELAGIAQRLLATQLIYSDRDDDAHTAALAARTSLAGSGPLLRAKAAATYARTLNGLGENGEAREAVQEALAVLADVPVEDPGREEAEADALTTLAVLDEQAGRPDDALSSLHRALAVAVSAGDLITELRVAYNIAANRYYAGHLLAARDAADSAARRADEVGLTWGPYGADARSLQVVVRYALGSWDEAAALSRPPSSPLPQPAEELLTALGMYVAVGRGEKVQARELATHTRDALAAMVASGCGAEALLWRGRAAESLEIVTAGARRLVEEWGEASLGGIWLSALGIAAHAELAGDARLRRDSAAASAAVTAAGELLESARLVALRGRPRGGGLGPEARAWLARAAAEQTRVEGASDVELWLEALDAFGYGHVYEQARCRWRLGEALAASDPPAAETQLRSALEVAVRLGARPLESAVVELAGRRRLDIGRALRPVTAGLTARERQVLDLLARGLTNRQVGATLFISEKTASVHVSNLLAKLGASGRTEAVAKAAKLGLLDS